MNKLAPLHLNNKHSFGSQQFVHNERASPMNTSIAFKIESFTELRLGPKKMFRALINHAQLARRGFHRIGLWRRKK